MSMTDKSLIDENYSSNLDVKKNGSVRLTQYVLPYIIFIVAWIIGRIIDFWSGLVEYSLPRLFIAILLPILLLLIFHVYQTVEVAQIIGGNISKILNKLLSKKWWILVQITVLTTFGFIIYATREMRGANMGDTPVFRQSVENTANFHGLLYNDLVGSQLRAHSNFFLLFMVPAIWVFGSAGWFVIQYLHSFVIAAWTYIVGWNVTRKTYRDYALWSTLLTISFFLAVYYQHATFYDTRFSALAVVIFIVGWLKSRKLLCVLGFIGLLITRETTLISLLFALPFLPPRESLHRMRWIFFVVTVLWLVLYTLTIQSLDGASGTSRVDECISSPSLSAVYVNCILQNVGAQIPLKIAYTVRLISFAPFSLFNLSAIAAMLPDFGLAWLSKDYIFYNLMWHYYLPLLGIILLLGFHQMRFFIRSRWLQNLLLLWTLCIGLWQFLTTIRLSLF